MLQPVQLFKILSDETRLAIILLLREAGELCVCDICAATSESQPKISRHMAILRDAGLVLDRREGKWVYYRLSPHMPAWAAETICHRLAVPARGGAWMAGKIGLSLLLISKHIRINIYKGV